LPRDLTGAELAKRLERLGYIVTRQDWQPHSSDESGSRRTPCGRSKAWSSTHWHLGGYSRCGL